MINHEEQAICKRRGAHTGISTKFWERCRWCGTWYRLVQKVEERDEDPPEDEQSPTVRLERK